MPRVTPSSTLDFCRCFRRYFYFVRRERAYVLIKKIKIKNRARRFRCSGGIVYRSKQPTAHAIAVRRVITPNGSRHFLVKDARTRNGEYTGDYRSFVKEKHRARTINRVAFARPGPVCSRRLTRIRTRLESGLSARRDIILMTRVVR